MANYDGRATAGLTTGIIGTSLGAINSGLLGNIGGLFGNNCNGAMYACSDNMAVNRYEAQQSARIAELETEVKLRDANTYTDSKLNDLRNYVEHKFDRVERELCDQRTYNAVNTANLNCIGGQVAELLALTKRVVPNGSICPGWGDVTVSVTPAPTTGA